MPKNELPNDFEAKLQRKKKEEKKAYDPYANLDPEERKRRIERDKVEQVRYEERRKIEEKGKEEKRRRDDFFQKCDEKLRPIFELVGKTVLNNDTFDVHCHSFTIGKTYYYQIKLKWNYEVVQVPSEPLMETVYSSIGLVIQLCPDTTDQSVEDEMIIIPLSKQELKQTFLGKKLKWTAKVTLDDPDWKEKVEDELLEQLKQIGTI